MHLAQVNIGRIFGPMDSPVMAEFKANLDPINELAEATPGFVWRLKSDSGNVYKSHHLEFFKRRTEWTPFSFWFSQPFSVRQKELAHA